MEEKLLEELRDAGKLFSFLKEAATQDVDELIRRIRTEPLGYKQYYSMTQRFFNFIGWSERVPVVLDEIAFDEEWRRRGKPQIIYHGDRRERKTDARLFALQCMGKLQDTNGQPCKQFMGTCGVGTFFGPDANIARGDTASYLRHTMFKGFFNEKARMIEAQQADRDMYKIMSECFSIRTFLGCFVGVGYAAIYAALAGYNVLFSSLWNKPYEWIVLDRSVTTICNKIVDCATLSVNAKGVVEDW